MISANLHKPIFCIFRLRSLLKLHIHANGGFSFFDNSVDLYVKGIIAYRAESGVVASVNGISNKVGEENTEFVVGMSMPADVDLID